MQQKALIIFTHNPENIKQTHYNTDRLANINDGSIKALLVSIVEPCVLYKF